MGNMKRGCIYDISDDECKLCQIHGYIYSCYGCKDYEIKLENRPAVIDYWSNICSIQARQTAKGYAHYGQSLEENTDLSDVQMITMAQEKAIDFLMYMEGLKQRLINLHEKMGIYEDDGR